MVQAKRFMYLTSIDTFKINKVIQHSTIVFGGANKIIVLFFLRCEWERGGFVFGLDLNRFLHLRMLWLGFAIIIKV